MRHWFRVTRDYVAWRERTLIGQEDAAIRAARRSATTDEERAFLDRRIAEREQNRGRRPTGS